MGPVADHFNPQIRDHPGGNPGTNLRSHLRQMPPIRGGIRMGVDSRNHPFAPGLPSGRPTVFATHVAHPFFKNNRDTRDEHVNLKFFYSVNRAPKAFSTLPLPEPSPHRLNIFWALLPISFAYHSRNINLQVLYPRTLVTLVIYDSGQVLSIFCSRGTPP